MGRSYLQAAALARGTGVDPLTLREVYQHIVHTCVQSSIVTGIEPLVLEEPVLKLRAHLGALAFLEVFLNTETGKTSFALIKNSQRMSGADNTPGWHIHPFDSPESHVPCAAMSFEMFLRHVESHQDTWEQPC